MQGVVLMERGYENYDNHRQSLAVYYSYLFRFLIIKEVTEDD